MRLLVSVGVLWSVGVWSLCVVRCDQQPVLTTGNHGDVHVVVPGIPGAVSVSVSVSGDLQESNHELISNILITTPSVEGNWRAKVRDVSGSDGVIHYVIEYLFPDGVHTVRGSQSLAHKETAVGQSLSSKRYLTRRATTVLFDDFSSGQIDRHKWFYTINAGWFPNAKQAMMYTPEPVNSYVKNGVLHIRPTLTVDHFGADFLQHGNLSAKALWGHCQNGVCETHGWAYQPVQDRIAPIMSAMMRSHASIRYGKVEIVAKLALGDWMWNALWLMPAVHSAYGPWPASGEIDIVETPGNRHSNHAHGNRSSIGANLDRSTIHLGVSRAQERHIGGEYILPHGNFGNTFHTYWLDWTEDSIRMGVDDVTVLHVPTPDNGFYHSLNQHGHNVWENAGKNAPFDQPFLLIMNVAVGGKAFNGGGWENHPYPIPWDPQSEDQVMQFWQARHLWEPTWQGESASMQIRSVKMQQY